MSDELEQMSPNQRRALDNALSALEAFASIWAAEIRLSDLSARIAAVPSEAERAKRIAAMIEQGFIEGAYRHYLDHKDKCDEIEAARATADCDSVIEQCAAVLDRRINGWRARSTAIFNGGILADELDYLAYAIRALKSQRSEV